MQKNLSLNPRLSEIAFSALVLTFLLVFTYGIFVEAPYSGFYYDPASGRIVSIYVDVDPESSLQEGDVLKQVGLGISRF